MARPPCGASLPQIVDIKAIFYTLDVDHTQTHSTGVCGVGLDCLERVPRILPDPYRARKGSHADHRRVHDRLLNLRRADPRRSGVVDNSHVGDCAVSDIQVFSGAQLISHYQQRTVC